MMKITLNCAFILLLSFISTLSYAHTYTSTNRPTQLIELYTSEGCSSCPPADRWVNNLKNHPKLWSEFIPIAFHVDYWDYIGWKDPFADPLFTRRQRQYTYERHLSGVYTPAMLLNGKEWLSWRRQSQLKLPQNTARTGKLSVNLDKQMTIKARFLPVHAQSSDLQLNIAILGFDVQSTINAGENNGHTFTHNFVVLGYKSIAMKLNKKGTYTATIEQFPDLHQQANKLAISAWINTKNSLAPIQATGGWIE